MTALTLDARTGGPAGLRRGATLALHLAAREVASAHRWTVLGWLWPVVRQLVQLAVLVFAFSKVIDLNIPDYPVFVFTGLLAWGWFTTGVGAASTAILAKRHLVLQPGFPVAVLPVVAVTVPFLDVLVGLPVLLALLVEQGGVSWTAILVPLVALVQFALTVGLAWIAAGLTVFFRDIPNLVAVTLTVLFYLTPVFFPLARVPVDYRWLLELNPIAGLIESYRALLLEDRLPEAQHILLPLAAGLAALLVGRVLFRRLSAGFVDEL